MYKRQAYVDDAPEFLREVEACVRASGDRGALFDGDAGDPDRSLRFVAVDDDDVDGPGTEAILRYLTDEAAREAAG